MTFETIFLSAFVGCHSASVESGGIVTSEEDGSAPDTGPASEDSASAPDTGFVEDSGSIPADTCGLPVPSTFTSVEEHEVGLGPDGEAMGHWTLEFTAVSFFWHHSDHSEEGSYTCAGDLVTGEAGGMAYEGYFDSSSGILSWDGLDYIQE